MCSVLARVRGTPQCWYTAGTSTYHLLHTTSCLPSPDPGPQRTREFDLYMIFHPLLSKDKAIGVGNQLYRWIKVTQTHTHTCVRAPPVHVHTHMYMCMCVHMHCHFYMCPLPQSASCMYVCTFCAVH